MFEIFIAGEPRPQGSKKAFNRGAHIVLVEANKDLPAWRLTMEKMLQLKKMELSTPFHTAVSVSLSFWLSRPKSVTRPYPTKTYDIDKLTRACLDALTKSGVIRDDSDVVDLVARKSYDDNHESGVLITVTPFDNDLITEGVETKERKKRGLV